MCWLMSYSWVVSMCFMCVRHTTTMQPKHRNNWFTYKRKKTPKNSQIIKFKPSNYIQIHTHEHSKWRMERAKD